MPSMGQDREHYVLESSKPGLWNCTHLHQEVKVLTKVVTSNSINSLYPHRSRKRQTLCNLSPDSDGCSQWPELSPMCSERQTQSHQGSTVSSRPSTCKVLCPQPGEGCHSCLSLHSFLIPVEEGLLVTWGSQRKKPLVLAPHVYMVWTEAGLRAAEEGICLSRQRWQSSLPPWKAVDTRVMWPLSIRLPSLWGEGDTDGKQRSSKGKFLLQGGPKVPAIKEIIVVLHLAYLWPLLLVTSLSASEWISTFRKESRNTDAPKEREEGKKSSCSRPQADCTSLDLFKICEQRWLQNPCVTLHQPVLEEERLVYKQEI